MSCPQYSMAVCGVGLGHTPLAGLPAALTAPDLDALPALMAHYYGQSTPPPLRRVPRYARLGLVAALRAMQNAGWEKDQHAHDMACIVGSAWGSVAMSMDYMDSLLDSGPRLSSPTAFSHAVNNMGAGLMSLLLQTRGACQTIAQFELSFAGALQAAALELASGRAQRVLVGALDESDARFTHACPEALPGVCHDKNLVHEGAVFLCVEAASKPQAPKTALLRVLWQQAQHAEHAQAKLLLSGAAEHPQGLRLQEYYGQGPLGQALNVSLALHSQTNCVCRCKDMVYGRQADVEVKYDTVLES